MLHLINYTFCGPDEAERCLARFGGQDLALFIGNGVFALRKASTSAVAIESVRNRIRCFALLPDLEVRGIPLSDLIPNVGTVDYSGFVGLCVQHGPVHSWFK